MAEGMIGQERWVQPAWLPGSSTALFSLSLKTRPKPKGPFARFSLQGMFIVHVHISCQHLSDPLSQYPSNSSIYIDGSICYKIPFSSFKNPTLNLIQYRWNIVDTSLSLTLCHYLTTTSGQWPVNGLHGHWLLLPGRDDFWSYDATKHSNHMIISISWSYDQLNESGHMIINQSGHMMLPGRDEVWSSRCVGSVISPTRAGIARGAV